MCKNCICNYGLACIVSSYVLLWDTWDNNTARNPLPRGILHSQSKACTHSVLVFEVHTTVLTLCTLCTANHTRWRLATGREQGTEKETAMVATLTWYIRRSKQLMMKKPLQMNWCTDTCTVKHRQLGNIGCRRYLNAQPQTWMSLWLTQLCASFFAMSVLYPHVSIKWSAANLLMSCWLWTIRILRWATWVLRVCVCVCVHVVWWWRYSMKVLYVRRAKKHLIT